jgi:transcriptional regulator with XRE-family HTH domain
LSRLEAPNGVGATRRFREAKGWTQEILAGRAGLDRSYVAGIEAGLRNPSTKALARIARALGIRLSVLFEGVE